MLQVLPECLHPLVSREKAVVANNIVIQIEDEGRVDAMQLKCLEPVKEVISSNLEGGHGNEQEERSKTKDEIVLNSGFYIAYNFFCHTELLQT